MALLSQNTSTRAAVVLFAMCGAALLPRTAMATSIRERFNRAHGLYLKWEQTHQASDLEDALHELGLAAKAAPANTTVLQWQGFLYMKQGSYEQALPPLTKAAELNHRLYQPLINLGYCNNALQHYTEAALAYSRAIDVLQTEQKSRNNPVLQASLFQSAFDLGNVRYQLHQYAAAETAYQQALAFNKQLPQNISKEKKLAYLGIQPAAYRTAKAYNALGVALLAQKHFAEAVNALQKAASAQPGNAVWLRHLGNASHDLALAQPVGSADQKTAWRQAENAYAAALNLEPHNYAIRENMGIALVEMGHYQKGMEAFKQAEADRSAAGKSAGASPQALFHYGLAAMHAGSRTEAVNLMQQASAADPSLAEAWHWQGYMQLQQKQYPQAIKSLQHALLLQPNSADVNLNLGSALFQSGDYPAAETRFQQLVKLQPHAAWPEYYLGNALLKQNKLQMAQTAYQKAVQLDPHGTDIPGGQAYSALGYALLAQKEYSAAANAYSFASEQNPKNQDALRGLAITRYQLALQGNAPDQWHQAEISLQQAVAQNQNDVQLSIALAKAQMKTQSFPAAEATMQQLVQRDPGSIAALEALAQTQMNAGHLNAAAGTLKTVLAKQPDNLVVMRQLAGTYMTLTDYQDAVPVNQTILQQDPADSKTAINQVNALLHLNRQNQAVSLMQQTAPLANNPQDRALLYQMLGYQLYLKSTTNPQNMRHSEQMAERFYQLSRQLEPHNVNTLRGLGVISEKLGAYDHALAYYTAAIHQQPSDASLYVARGVCYEKLRKIKLAIADYHKAVQLDPQNAIARANLQRFAVLPH